MRKLAYPSVVAALVVLAFLGGAWWSHHDPAPTSGARQVLHYACPMHPQYQSDRPGDCPSCGMRLEPVYADGAGQPVAGSEGRPPAPGTVHVSPARQQTIGVRLGVVERVSGTRTLRTTGRVAPNENDVYPIVAGAEGWVREVGGATTGSLVKKGEVLLSLYAPEFVVAQQSFYSGLETLGLVTSEQLRTSNPGRVFDGVERFANTLRNLGVSEEQLAEMRTKRELTQYIRVVSPVGRLRARAQRICRPALRPWLRVLPHR